MANVIMYSKETCPYCIQARELLNKKQVAFTEIRIDLHPQFRDEMISKSGHTTVPQIFINGQSIGGCDDLHALEAQGTLNQLLQG
jgi:glutaredoxin 3